MPLLRFVLSLTALYALFHLAWNGSVIIVRAQTAPPASASASLITFEHLATPNVMQSVIYAMTQDSRGFMWFGTKDGLYRYDGLRTTTFIHNPLDSLSLGDNRVLNVFEDSDGDLWISTQDGGLNRFNRTTATFTRFQPKTDKSGKPVTTAIRSNRVAFAYQDRARRFWVGTENGLHLFDKIKQTFSVITANSEDPTALPSNYIRAVLETRNGTIWFGTIGGGLCRWNDATKTFSTFKRDPANTAHTIADNTIHSITEDPHGILWIGTARGLTAFNPTTGNAENFFNSPHEMRSLSENIVWDVLCTRAGTLWVATQNGLDLFHPETRDFTRFTASSDLRDISGLPSNYINALYEDTQGRVWIGMYGGGVSVIDPYKRKFELIGRGGSQAPLQTLSDNNIWATLEDPDGTIWLGTSRGLNRYNPISRIARAFHADTLRYGPMSNNFNYLTEDSTGKIWCSTYGGGVNVFDRHRQQFVAHYKFEEGSGRSIPSDRVTAVYYDKAHRIWVGTVNGTSRFVPKTNDFEPMFTGKGAGSNASPRLTHPTIKCFFEDSKGRLWIGTAGGLNCLNPTTGVLTRFKSIPSDTTTLSHNNIRQLIEDKAHRIWVATSGGLNLLLESTSESDTATSSRIRFRRITTANGLPSNLVAGTLPDKHGKLWIAHNLGICTFNPATFSVEKMYDTDDGLQGQEFRALAIMNLRDGRMLFGGANGFNTFHPDSVRIDSTLPRIAFTGFKVFNQNRHLPINISEAREITLSYKDYIFSIEFASLDFTNAEKTRYAYKMEGLDNDWVENGEQRTATYTNLAGGEYIFRVRASNHDGVWNNEGIALKIIIIPPFWETWWFRSLAICALAAIVVLGVRMRVRGVQRQNTLLEQVVEQRTSALKVSNHQLSDANEQLRLANVEKNEFLGIVAHDLKNPLSTIKLAAKMLHETSQKMTNDDIQDISGDILTTSNRMFDLITNLLDVNRLEQNAMRFQEQAFDVAPLLTHSAAQYHAQAEAKYLRLHVSVPPKTLSVFADESATMQIIDNLVSNAVKYSPQEKNIYCSAQPVTLENGKQFVQIAVRDEGPGLSDEDKQKLFGKFARLSAQPTAGEHSTGLGLSIVKKMVEAMNGHVRCESTLGAGATFIVELPAAV